MNSPIFPEQLVNSVTAGIQTAPEIAALPGGYAVAVWQSENADGDGYGIVAQVFNGLGEPVGPQMLVNQEGLNHQAEPSVAATADGGFVIVWSSYKADNFYDVEARKFGADFLPAGDAFTANDKVESATQPSVAALPGGGFVIGWYDNAIDYDVRLRHFASDGTPAGAGFDANTTGADVNYNYQGLPALATIQPSAPGLPGGGYVAIWRDASSNDGSSDGIYGQVFNPDGSAAGTEFLVNTTTLGHQRAPSVAGLDGGRFVVVWQDDQGNDGYSSGVFGQVFEGDGTPAGAEFIVSSFGGLDALQTAPKVTATADGGFFVSYTAYVYGSTGEPDGSHTYGVFGRSFDMDGLPTSGEVLVNESVDGTQDLSAAAGLSNGDVLALWVSQTSGAAGDGSAEGVYSRLLGDPLVARSANAAPEVEAVSAAVTFDEADIAAAFQRIDLDGAAAVSDQDSADFDGGRLVLSVSGRSEHSDGFLAADGAAQHRLGFVSGGAVAVDGGGDVSVGGTVVGALLSGGSGVDGEPLIVALNANADAAAVEVLVEHLGYANGSDDPDSAVALALLLEDGDGGASEPLRIDVTVNADADAHEPGTPERRLNAVTASEQYDPEVAALTGGGWVGIWTSYDATSGRYNAVMRAVDAQGVPTGWEQVVSDPAASAFTPDIAGLTDGGWVAVWEEASSIYASRFDAAGATVFSQQLVETSVGTQNAPHVAGLANGGYVIGWTGSGAAGDGNGDGAVVQLFNSLGAPVGTEIVVNSVVTTGQQNINDVAALDSGRFAVIWQDRSSGADGSGSAVLLRLFDATGTPEGAEVVVNQTHDGEQSDARAATLSNGDLVIAWTSANADGSGNGVFARIYDSTGVALTDEFRVNDYVTNGQVLDSVTALADGGFAIAFHGDGYDEGDATGIRDSNGVWAQEFDADGARRDSQTQLHEYTESTQSGAALAGLTGGGYVALWETYAPETGDADGRGVSFRLMGAAAGSEAPAFSTYARSLTLDEDEAQAGAALFASGFVLTDADSADFDGGVLRVGRRGAEGGLSAYAPGDDDGQDSLLLQAVHGVTVSGGALTVGATVFVNGVAIGTVVQDGQAGADLEIALTGGATPGAMQSVLAALGYANGSEDPSPTRTYTIDIADGDGGWSGPADVVVHVTQVTEPDAPVAAGPARAVDPDAASVQEASGAAALNDGGWITVYAEDGIIRGRRFDSDGGRQGEELTISDWGAGANSHADVAALSDGGFAVIYQGYAPGTTALEVLVRTYDAAGAPVGAAVQVNTTTGGTQHLPDIAAIPAALGGGFWTIWADDAADIQMQRFDASGAPVSADGATPGHDEQTIPTNGGVYQPSLTILPNGNVVALWTEYQNLGGGSTDDARAQVFDVDGVPLSGPFEINETITGNHERPQVAVTASGGFVAVWDGPGERADAVHARFFDETGTALTGEIEVGDRAAANTYPPSVAVMADGRVAIGYHNSSDAWVQILAADGTRLDGNFRVNDEDNGADGWIDLVAPTGGGLVVGFTEASQIEQRLYGPEGLFLNNAEPVMTGFSTARSFTEDEVSAGPVRLDADAAVAFSDVDAVTFDGFVVKIAVDAPADVDEFLGGDGPAQEVLDLVNGDAGAGDVQRAGSVVSVNGAAVAAIGADDGTAGRPLEIVFNAAAAREDVEAVLSALGYANLSDDPGDQRTLRIDLIGADGHAAASHAVSVAVTPVADSTFAGGDARRVNARTHEDQQVPHATELSDGRVIVVWSSYDDDSNLHQARGQLYSPTGAPMGEEFEVAPNASAALNVHASDVVAMPGGGFAVIYYADGAHSVAYQLFDGSGAATGGEVVVDDGAIGNAYYAEASAAASGGFLITWTNTHSSFDGAGYAVRQVAVNAAGVMGVAEVVNVVNTSSTQEKSASAAITDGGAPAGHVVVFASATSGGDGDGSGQGVFARVYDAAGVALGGDFQVNQHVSGAQNAVAVAGLAGGGFVVAWQSDGEDGSGYGIYARMYDHLGVALDDAFRVNDYTQSNQYDPNIVALDDGGFVIGWSGHQGGNYDREFMGQRYDAAGARIDGAFEIAPRTAQGNETDPVLFDFGANGFGAVWTENTQQYYQYGDTGDGSGNAVGLRLFGASVAPDHQGPGIHDLDRHRNLDPAAVVAAPAILDDAVAVSDSAAGLASGSLRFYWALRGEATDTLSIEAGGALSRPNATDIVVDGVVIGQVDASENGVGGAALQIALTADATEARVRILLEHLAYSSTAAAADLGGYKTVGVILADALGIQSEPDGITLYFDGTPDAETVSINDFMLNENENNTYQNFTSESAMQAAPHRFDAAVDLDGFDASGFDGGYARIAAASPNARIVIVDDGTGARQIGVSGADVTYEGVVIGTINGALDGVSGTDLQVDLNAAADAEAVEALLEAFALSIEGMGGVDDDEFAVTVTVNGGAGTASATGHLVVDRDLSTPEIPTGDIQVNTVTAQSQTGPVVAATADGGYMAFWSSSYQDNNGASDFGVFAQRFNAHGDKLGAEIQINDQEVSGQTVTSAVTLADGRMLAIWHEEHATDGASGSVRGTFLTAEGAVDGPSFQINDLTASTQNHGAAVALSDGRFAVAYETHHAGNYDIYLRVFAADGTPEGASIQLNSTTGGHQRYPQVQELPDGSLMAVWNEESGADGHSHGVFAQRVDPTGAGALLSFDGAAPGADETQINVETDGAQQYPVIAALAPSATLPAGGFAVAFTAPDEQTDVFIRFFALDGTPVGDEIRVNGTTQNYDYVDALVATPDGGVMVLWQDQSPYTGASDHEQLVRKILPDGTYDGPVRQLNAHIQNGQEEGRAVLLPGGGLAAVWRSHLQDGDSYGVFTRVLDAPDRAAGAGAPALLGDFDAAFAEGAVNAGPQLLNPGAHLGLSDADSADFDGGALHVWRLTLADAPGAEIFGAGDGPEQDRLTLLDGDGIVLLPGAPALLQVDGIVIGELVSDGAAGADLILNFNSFATPALVERAIARLAYANDSDDPIASRTFGMQVTDGDGGASEPLTFEVKVTPEGDAALVAAGARSANAQESGDQRDSKSDALYDAAGVQIGWVTVWTSTGQDGDNTGYEGVYGQIFDLGGAPVGTEFRVNDAVRGHQYEPSVTGLSGGGFVVAWRDDSGYNPAGFAAGETGIGVFARSFDENGVAVSGDVLLSDVTASSQYQPALAALADGGFAAVWRDDARDGSSASVHLGLFDADGTPRFASVQANVQTASAQVEPDLAQLADGRIAVIWRSETSGAAGDGDGYGVIGAIYNLDGTLSAGEFVVNSTTDGAQYGAAVAALDDGGFVVVWTDPNGNGTDGGNSAVLMQRYDAAGAPIDGERLVNDSYAGYQDNPRVVGLDTGGWVVVWEDDRHDGSSGGIFAQLYDDAGARVDGEILVNEVVDGWQGEGDVAALPGGGFAVSWSTADSSQNGIETRAFLASGAPAADPALSSAPLVASLEEADANAGGQALFGAVFVEDSAADFDGGALTVAVIDGLDNNLHFNPQDDAAQDLFTVQEVGGATRSGADVLVGGVIVGVVSGEVPGAALSVTFNAAAAAAEVQAVLRAVGYANLSDAPDAQRQISVRLTDGDGGAADFVTALTIAPETDGLVPSGAQQTANSFAAGEQRDSRVAATEDGGFVVVWSSNNQDAAGDGSEGVFAQRFDASGAPAGPEFQVNPHAQGNQDNPAAVGLAGGGFAIAYEDDSRIDSSRDSVFVQVYDAAGEKVGGRIITAANSDHTAETPELSALPGGGFAMVTRGYDYGAGEYQIRLERYDATGAQIGAIQTVQSGPSSLTEPDVAVAADGVQAVVYREYGLETSGAAGGSGVFLELFDAAGAQIGVRIQANTTERDSQTDPQVVALDGGGWVVVWTSYQQGQHDSWSYEDVYFQRFDATGALIGPETEVSVPSYGNQDEPRVAAAPGGGFDIVFTDNNALDGAASAVQLQQYDADGTRIDDAVTVNAFGGNSQTEAAVARLADGRLAVSFTDYAGEGADESGAAVSVRLLDAPGAAAAAVQPVIDGINASVDIQENDANGVPQLIDANGAAAVSHAGSDDYSDGSILLSSVIASAPLIDQIPSPDDLTQDVLGLRAGGRIAVSSAAIGGVVSVDGIAAATIVQDGRQTRPFELSLMPGADSELVELLLESLTYRNLSDDPLEERRLRLTVTDADGVASDPVFIDVNVIAGPDGATPVGLETDMTAGGGFTVSDNQLAGLAGSGGDFIGIWRSEGQDGDQGGIYAQRFDVLGAKVARDGTPLGAGVFDDEFLINARTVDNQHQPQVTGLADGGFLVTFVGNLGAPDYNDIHARRFDAQGVAVALDGTALIAPDDGETLVAELRASNQYEPEATELTGGQIVFAWHGDGADGSGSGILARVYDPGTGTFAPQQVVNTATAGAQTAPSIVALADGGFLVAWQSIEGSHYDIHAQRFDAGGTPQGAAFTVNSTTEANQTDVHVARLNDGALVFTWTDSTADLSGDGVFGRIFAPDGTALGDEFRVNDHRSSTQHQPDIAALDTGGFVIAYSGWYGPGGESYDVFVQQYASDGSRVDNQLLVNGDVTGNQTSPSVAALEGGGFAVGWDGSAMVQVFGNDAPALSPVTIDATEDVESVIDVSVFDAGFTDGDGQTLAAIRIGVLPGIGTLFVNGVAAFAGQEVSRAQLLAGELTYLGAPDAFGADSFLWTASDGIAFSSDLVTAQITIAPVNDAPGLEAGPDATPTEGATFTRTLNLTDPDADTRSFTVDWGDGSGPVSFNSASLSPTITHVYAAEGVYTVTVDVDDNAGEANSTDTDGFTVTVVNGDPAARDDYVYAAEDGPATSGDVTANNGFGADGDPGGDPLSVALVNGAAFTPGAAFALPSGALLTMNADGTFDYDPNGAFESAAQGANALDSFTYTLSDGEGGTDVAAVTVFVAGANDDPDARDDAFNVNSDGTLNANVIGAAGGGADADVDDGAALEVTLIDGAASVGAAFTLASGAIVTIQSNGDFTYDPNGAVGTDGFTYTLSDEHGATDTAAVTIIIDDVNASPVAQDDAFLAVEDVALTGDPLADNGSGADADPDGDALAVANLAGSVVTPGATSAWIPLPSGARVRMTPSGAFEYDQQGAFDSLGAGQTGADSFAYTVEDGNGGSDTGTIFVTIDGANDDPVAADDTDATTEDAAATGNVLTGAGADSDPDAPDSLSVSAVAGLQIGVGAPVATSGGGAIVIQADGSYTYDPTGAWDHLDVGDLGSDSVRYTVTDGNGGFDTATLTIAITGANDDPDAQDDGFAVVEGGALSGDLFADNGAGADADPDASDAFTVTAVNGSAGNVGGGVLLPSGAMLTVSASGAMSYAQNGAFAHLASGDTAFETFTYTIADQFGATDTATVTIEIAGAGDAPDAADDGGLTTDEETVLAGIDVLANDTDADSLPAQLFVAEIEGVPVLPGGFVDLAGGGRVTLAADGTLSFDPNGDFEDLGVGQSAPVSFDYTVEDQDGLTDTGAVSITVTGVNDAPVALNDARATNQDTPISGDVFINNGGGADYDVDGDAFLVSGYTMGGVPGVVGTPTAVDVGGLITLNADGSFDFDPNGAYDYLGVGQSRTTNILYTVDDGQGGTDPAFLSIQVAGANDMPVALDDDVAATPSAVVTGSVFDDNGNGADYDPDATDSMGVTLFGPGGTGVLGGTYSFASGALLVLNANGSFTYDANGAHDGLAAGASATDSVSYTIADGHGGTATAVLNFIVSGDNLPPAARNDALETDEESAASFDLFADNGAGADADPNGDAFTLVAVDGSAALVGAGQVLASGALLNVGPDGAVSFDPNGGYEGLGVGQSATETFTYTIDDGNGGTDTATATITITGVNDDPAAQDDAVSVHEDAGGSGNLLADNGSGADGDVDGDALQVSAVDGSAANLGAPMPLAGGGSVTVLASGAFTFSSNGAYEGLGVGDVATETFTYAVSDGQGGTDMATVTITVNGANDDPDAVNDAVAADEDLGATGSLFADNGSGADADVDGDGFTVTAVNGLAGNVGAALLLAGGGLVTVLAGGGFTFDANGAYEGLGVGDSATESFAYTITDDHGATDSATVTITVNGANDDPTAAADALSADEDAGATGSLFADNGSGADADVDGDGFTVTAVNGLAGNVGTGLTLAGGGILTVLADGSYSFDPDGAYEALGPGDSATESFTYTIADDHGGTDSATVTITINGANDDPTARDDAAETAAGVAVDIDVLANDDDVDGAAPTVTGIAVQGVGGVASILPSGQVRYTPKVGFSGPDSFTYEITDDDGATATAVVNVIVAAAPNQPPQAADDPANATLEGVPVNIDVLGNDGDPDADPLIVTGVSDPANGSAVVLPDGSVDYTPDAGFIGTDTFTYDISDGNGGTDTATVTVEVTEGPSTVEIGVGLIAPGDAGFAPAPTSSADEGDDGDVTDVWFTLTRTGSTTLPATVTVLVTMGGVATQVPVVFAAGQSEASFSRTVIGDYQLELDETISAQILFTDRAEVSVGVPDVAEHTVVNDDFPGTIDLAFAGQGAGPLEMIEGDAGVQTVTLIATRSGDLDGPVTAALGLSGALGLPGEIDGLPPVIAFSDGQTTASITLTLFSDLADEPDEDFNVFVTSTDRDGIVGGTQAELIVLDDDDVPTALDDAYAAAPNGSVAMDLLANDSDPDGQPLSVTEIDGQAIAPGGSVTLASGAVVRMSATGDLEYDTDGAFAGLGAGQGVVEIFTYVAFDGDDVSAPAEVRVTIAPNQVDGTTDSDETSGTDDNDVVSPGGGADLTDGGAGADLFDFAVMAGNGRRDHVTISDYEIGVDAVDLGDGVGVLYAYATGGDLNVFTDGGEYDTLVFENVVDIAQIDFI